jgi:tetratricopeptide (TPR) repeat protein
MTTAGNPALKGRQRLDSWKEIAAFFGRDERTVNRWEKELGLPVHRLPGRAKGPVYAYTDELSGWMATPHEDAAASELGTEQHDGTVPLGPMLVREVAVATTQEPPLTAPLFRRIGLGWLTTGWFVAGGMLVVACILGWALLHGSIASRSQTNTSNSKAGHSASAGIVQASTPAHNPEAEQLYLKGRYYWNKRTSEDLTKAVDFFTQAIVKDPGYSNAYVGLADCYNLLREYTLMPPSEAYPRALAAAQKAVELDDKSSEAHASLAFASFYGRWDIATADREFQRAIELEPDNAVAHHWYATYLAMLGRFPESMTEIDRAQALNPTSTTILADKGDLLLLAGRTEEALALLKPMEATDPKFVSIPRYLKNVYFTKADYPNFLIEWQKEALLVHDATSLALVTEAEKGLAAGGERGMLESMLTLQKKYCAKELVSPFEVARTDLLLGNRQEAFQYLKIAYDKRDPLLIVLKIDSAFASLRSDATYRELLARMNFPEN